MISVCCKGHPFFGFDTSYNFVRTCSKCGRTYRQRKRQKGTGLRKLRPSFPC